MEPKAPSSFFWFHPKFVGGNIPCLMSDLRFCHSASLWLPGKDMPYTWKFSTENVRERMEAVHVAYTTVGVFNSLGTPNARSIFLRLLHFCGLRGLDVTNGPHVFDLVDLFHAPAVLSMGERVGTNSRMLAEVFNKPAPTTYEEEAVLWRMVHSTSVSEKWNK